MCSCQLPTNTLRHSDSQLSDFFRKPPLRGFFYYWLGADTGRRQINSWNILSYLDLREHWGHRWLPMTKRVQMVLFTTWCRSGSEALKAKLSFSSYIIIKYNMLQLSYLWNGLLFLFLHVCFLCLFSFCVNGVSVWSSSMSIVILSLLLCEWCPFLFLLYVMVSLSPLLLCECSPCLLLCSVNGVRFYSSSMECLSPLLM